MLGPVQPSKRGCRASAARRAAPCRPAATTLFTMRPASRRRRVTDIGRFSRRVWRRVGGAGLLLRSIGVLLGRIGGDVEAAEHLCNTLRLSEQWAVRALVPCYVSLLLSLISGRGVACKRWTCNRGAGAAKERLTREVRDRAIVLTEQQQLRRRLAPPQALSPRPWPASCTSPSAPRSFALPARNNATSSTSS